MADPRELTVLPLADRVEELLLERAAEGASLGLGLCTWRELERELFAAAELAPIDDTAAELLIAHVAPSAAAGSSLEQVAGEAGFARAFRTVYHGLREGGCGVGELQSIARRLSGLAGRRSQGIARVARAYEAALGERELTDGAGARLRLPQRLAERPLPESVARVDRIVVEDLFDLPVVRARTLEALAARGKRVIVRLPELGDAPGLQPALEQLERVLAEEAPAVETSPKRYGGGPLASLHARLFGLVGEAPPLARVAVVEGEDPAAELRAIVAAVRARLDEGAAPDDLCVAVRSLPPWRDRLGAALDEAGIPWRDRRGAAAAGAPPCALALALLDLAERGLPRTELALVLTSRYVEGGVPPAGSEPFVPARRVAELLRAAGSRDDRGEGHAARLAAFATRAAAPPAAGDHRREGRATARTSVRAAEHLATLLPSLRLPEAATLGEHVHALNAAIGRLGVPARCRALEEREDGRYPVIDAAAARALARDQAALRALDAAGAALIGSARRVGLEGSTLPLGRFRDLLAAALDQATLRSRGARGGAVLLAEVAELPGRALAHLVIAGAVDGAFPLRRGPEPLFDDDDRAAFNRVAGRAVFRTRSAEEPLLFALACSAARESLCFTASVGDALGHTAVRSPFLDETLAALDGPTPVRLAAAVVAPAADCRARSQLLMRAALLARGGAPAPGDPSPPSLLAAVRADPELGARLEGALDRARRDVGGGAGGCLTSDRAREAVRALLRRSAAPFGAEVAWAASASTLEQYAVCPFRFFAARVLDLPELDALDDDLDTREGGTLLHDVARAAFEALAAAALLPLQGGARTARELEVARAAAEVALDGWEARHRTGPPGLWAVRREGARASITRLIEAEVRARRRLVPSAFETAFGLEGRPALLLPSPDGREAIAVRGRVDRVDEGEAIEVIDYKSGRVNDRLESGELARTQFQLPLYAAWARTRFGVPSVDAAYCSLRDGERSRSLAAVCEQRGWPLAALLELDPERRAAARSADLAPAAGARDLPDGGAPSVADRAWALLEALRSGRFDVRPHDPAEACARCAFATICRVDRATVS